MRCFKVLEKIETFYVRYFFENRAMYDVMWENILEPSRPQMTIWREDVLLLDTQGY